MWWLTFHKEVFMQSPSPRPTVSELLHAKLDALLEECDIVAETAAYGQTLDDMDEFFLVKGQKISTGNLRTEIARTR